MSVGIRKDTLKLEARCPWHNCRKPLQLFGASWSDDGDRERITLHYRCHHCRNTVTVTPQWRIARDVFERANELDVMELAS